MLFHIFIIKSCSYRIWFNRYILCKKCIIADSLHHNSVHQYNVLLFKCSYHLAYNFKSSNQNIKKNKLNKLYLKY